MILPTIQAAGIAVAALLSSTSTSSIVPQNGHLSLPPDANTTLVTVRPSKVITHPATTVIRDRETIKSWPGTTEVRTMPAYTESGVTHGASLVTVHQDAGAVTAVATMILSEEVFRRPVATVTVLPGDDFLWE